MEVVGEHYKSLCLQKLQEIVKLQLIINSQVEELKSIKEWTDNSKDKYKTILQKVFTDNEIDILAGKKSMSIGAKTK